MKRQELNLFSILELMISKWKLYLIMLISFLTISLLYVYIATPLFQAKTTFFIHTESPQVSSVYASILGGSSKSNFENQMIAIMKSKKMRQLLAKNFIEEYPNLSNSFLNDKKFSTDIQKYAYVEGGVLKLYDEIKFQKTKEKIHVITYKFSDRDVAAFILDQLLMQTKSIFHELELSAQKDMIKIIDSTDVTHGPVWPNAILILAFTIFLSFFLTTVIVLNKLLLNFYNKG